MNWGLEVVLIAFALVGYIGSGASLAVARYRTLDEGQIDVGMLGVAAMLLLFAGVCTFVAVGPFGVAAIGGIGVWTSYVLMARQIGMFAVETSVASEVVTIEQPHSRA
jgi:hypothetical protein